jgi:RNA polymerase sigma-70 factor, ECF subfamily
MSDERTESELSASADELVVRAKGDRTAFSRLYEKYYPEIARYCLRRLLIRTIAEDVISEVFLNVAEHLPTFSGRTDSDFRCWVYRIATNAINAHVRQFRRRQELLADVIRNKQLQANADLSTGGDSPEWPAVHDAVMELEERDRSIIMLRFFSNCSHEEIAQVVDATSGAVRTALSRILAHLRQKFKLSDVTDRPRGLPRQVDR